VSSLNELASYVIKHGLDKGAREVEAIVNDTRIGMHRFKNKAIHQNMDGHRSIGRTPFNLQVRIINRDGKLGQYSSTTLRNVEEAVKDALRCAEYGPELASFPEPKKATPLSGLYFDYTAKLSPEERVECINYMVDVAKDVDARIDFVGGLLSNVSSKTVIANSLGLDVEHAFTGGHVIVTSVAKEGTREGSGFSRSSNRDFHSIDFEAVAREAAQVSISTIGYQSRPVSVGRHEVIFKAEAAAEYIGTIMQQAFSVSRDPRTTARVPLGEQVFSEELSIVDNGRDPRTLLASAIDGEGTPKKLLSLVNHGIPENRCYNNALAKKEGKESTGHAHTPWTGYFWTGTGSGSTYPPTNQIFKPGSSSLEEMIADTKDGILVTRLRCPAGRSQTILPETIRADTQECWYIKNGEIAGPCNYIRFTDSLVETLKNIEVGDESTVQSVGSFVVPAVKLNSLYISQPSVVMIQ